MAINMRKMSIWQLETNKAIDKYKNYLSIFEREFVLKGIDAGILGKTMMVSARDGKLFGTEFGDFICSSGNIDISYPVAVDYYGFVKKSNGFYSNIKQHEKIEIRAMETKVVYFASIKISNISEISQNLVSEFSGFKKFLVALRGFTT